MVDMTVEEIGIYTVADLERERELDPRLRWELLDGELVMTPAPRFVHQDMVGHLYIRLMQAVPEDLVVAMAPLDVRLSDRTVLQPDLVLARREQAGDLAIEGVPLLAVEVLSPSTRRRDLEDKPDTLERAGCPHYWVLDPEELSLRAWHLVDGRYVMRTHAAGQQEVRFTEPVELTFRVAELLSRR